MKTILALTAAAAIGAAASLSFGGHAFAQSSHDGHGTPAASSGKSKESAAAKAYQAANAKMHKGMDIRFSNDADVDFVRGMIPHHQGAIDMAKVVLEHGKDEQTRAWAKDIIAAQEREISEMQAWLKKRGL